MFDYLGFVMQQPKRQEECLVSRHHVFVFVLFSTCVCTTCLNDLDHLASPSCSATVLPIPQHCLLKDPPSSVAICTPQGLAVKVTCNQDCHRRISPACIGQELPFQLSTVYLCTTWLDPKALVLLPGFCIAVAPLLPVLKTWLVQGLAWLLP
jgi:hypothetical protein